MSAATTALLLHVWVPYTGTILPFHIFL